MPLLPSLQGKAVYFDLALNHALLRSNVRYQGILKEKLEAKGLSAADCEAINVQIKKFQTVEAGVKIVRRVGGSSSEVLGKIRQLEDFVKAKPVLSNFVMPEQLLEKKMNLMVETEFGAGESTTKDLFASLKLYAKGSDSEAFKLFRTRPRIIANTESVGSKQYKEFLSVCLSVCFQSGQDCLFVCFSVCMFC